MHTLEKKQTLVFLVHAHFAQLLLYLVIYLLIIFLSKIIWQYLSTKCRNQSLQREGF